MTTSASTRDSDGRGYSVHLLGLVVVLLAGAHVALDRDPPATELAEASILLVFAAGVFFVGRRAAVERVPAADVLRIVTVGLGLGAVVGTLAGAFLYLRAVTGEPISESRYILSIGWSMGVGAGALIGYYFTGVERERAEQALLTKRLTILQRVLRHNIRNEVSVVRGLSNDLAASADDPETRRKLATVDAHVGRVYRLSENVQLLSDLWKRHETERLDLAAVARDEVSSFRETHPEVSVSVDLPERAPVEANRYLPVAVAEALGNAAAHNGVEGLSVDVSVRVDGGTGLATLEVVDDGSRIPEEELTVLSSDRELPLEHVTGLGLWVIYWVLDASGGRVEFENREPAGVAVRMSVPAA